MPTKHILLFFFLCTLAPAVNAQRYFEFSFTYHPASENFIVKTSDPYVIADALAELALPPADRIVMIFGPINYGNDGYNHNWNWHFKPDQWFLTGGNYEVCDGISSFIEEEPGFWIDTLGYFCPWYAHLEREIFNASVGTVNTPAVNVSVSPNPFSHSATLQWENPNHNTYQLILRNQLGQTVNTISNITGNQVTITKNHLPIGLYIYQLVNTQGTVAQGKLVVQ